MHNCWRININTTYTDVIKFINKYIDDDFDFFEEL